MRKHTVINGLIIAVLLGIVMNQAAWLINMYGLHQREFKANINDALHNAVFMELTERGEKMGGFSVFSSNFNPPNDVSRFFLKEVVMEDSTYLFTLDKNDPNTMNKIIQFGLKNEFPVDLGRMSIHFNEKLDKRYGVQKAYFDYLDLENTMLLKSSRPEKITLGRYVLTDTVPLDIVSSVGVVGYVENPETAILDIMQRQLILSALLIIMGIVSLIFISRSFIIQWKTEKMRQDSVNAMTHEFKRPISGAVALASTIPHYLEKKDLGRVLKYANIILMEMSKLTLYTKRIQQISNNEKSNLTLDVTSVEIIPFFESIQQRYVSPGSNEREIIIKMYINTLRKVMKVDLLHFSNVMDNLLENAIKYTAHPTVVIEIHVVDVTDGGLKISVRDNGIGISDKDKEYVFDRFYRVKREETKNKMGFGLGLTYVKSIIIAHEGAVTVNSVLNKGSEFTIFLKNRLHERTDTIGRR